MPIEIVEHYYQMIQHLDNTDKMALVEKIIHSVNYQESLVSSWEDDRSADEIIQDIKANAHVQRHIESFE